MNEAQPVLPLAAEASAPTVLVVDDDILVRIVASAYLRDCRFEVVEAGNADEAVRLVTAGIKVDLVFSDINMPGTMDGLGLATWLHGHHPHIKIILTSGMMPTSAPSGEVRPYGQILAKPYRYESLVRRICEMLGREGA